MINSVALLLRELQQAEARKLSEVGISHPGTIGDMYEGLTSRLLNLSIPEQFQVQVVTGFAEGHDGKLSSQMDIMVVHGEGREIPYAGAYCWPIEQVLAVFEVKKSLYGDEMADGINKMVGILELASEAQKASGGTDSRLKYAAESFARATGWFPLPETDQQSLPVEIQVLFDLFKQEQIAPVRVIFGYEGYVDSAGLGQAILAKIKSRKLFPEQIPSLVVCRSNSIVKLNGQPYASRMGADGYLPFLAGNSENPIRLLLEQLWTKLVVTFQMSVPMDDTLDIEALTPVLSCRLNYDAASDSRQIELRDDTAGLDDVDAPANNKTWEPAGTDIDEIVILAMASRSGKLDIDDPGFKSYAAEEGFDVMAICSQMVEKRFLAWTTKSTLRPVGGSSLTTILPSGGISTSSNAELHTLWLNEQLNGRTTND